MDVISGPTKKLWRQALKHRWSKCIILEGNYIEKEEIDLTQKQVRLVFYWLALVLIISRYR